MRKLTNKECCEIIKDLKGETYLALLREEPKVRAEFLETYGGEVLRDILNLSETRDEVLREDMYGLIGNSMDRLDLTCPPLEVFDDETLRRWYSEYEKIADILDDLNDEHHMLLDRAKYHAEYVVR